MVFNKNINEVRDDGYDVLLFKKLINKGDGLVIICHQTKVSHIGWPFLNIDHYDKLA